MAADEEPAVSPSPERPMPTGEPTNAERTRETDAMDAKWTAEAHPSEVHSTAHVHAADMAAADMPAATATAVTPSAQFRRRDCKRCRNRRDKTDFAKHVLLRASPLAAHIAAMLVNRG
jgi:hypothetical protein